MGAANSFGHHFVITTFGESHGPALGVVIDGCPSNIPWDETLLTTEIARRRPGQSPLVSARAEPDQVEVLSGIYQGRTLGTPIALMVRNLNQRSNDYDGIKENPTQRQGHGDQVWRAKYQHTDPRGGGRSSGRETVSRVMAAAVAKMFLRQHYPNLMINSYLSAIGPLRLSTEELQSVHQYCHTARQQGDYYADQFAGRFPSAQHQIEVTRLLQQTKEQGESLGATVEVLVTGMIPSLGAPVFHKLKADLAHALLGIGACSTFELGDWYTHQQDHQHSGVAFHQQLNRMHAYGGIQAGISTGEPLLLRLGFKPTSSVLDVAKQGRHDPCIAIRASVVAEAMVALVIADHVLWNHLVTFKTTPPA